MLNIFFPKNENPITVIKAAKISPLILNLYFFNKYIKIYLNICKCIEMYAKACYNISIIKKEHIQTEYALITKIKYTPFVQINQRRINKVR